MNEILEQIFDLDLLYTVETITGVRVYKVQGMNKYLPFYLWEQDGKPHAIVGNKCEGYYTRADFRHIVYDIYLRDFLTLEHNIDWWCASRSVVSPTFKKLFIDYGFVKEEDGKLIPLV